MPYEIEKNNQPLSLQIPLLALLLTALLQLVTHHSATAQPVSSGPEHSGHSLSTPTPTPTATPTAACDVVAVNFSHSAVYKEGAVRIDQATGGAQSLSCFEKLMNDTIKDVVTLYGYTSLTGDVYSADTPYNREIDDLTKNGNTKVSSGFSERFWTNLLALSGLTRSTFYPSKNDWVDCVPGGWRGLTHNGFFQLGGGDVMDTSNRTPGCTNGSFYLDGLCRLIPLVTLPAACAAITFFSEVSTPVSLVWEPEFRDSPPVPGTFKLNPQSSEKTWLWRGSSGMPLIVYDPEHTGIITSATQLMGTWAFGGQGGTESDATHNPWKNGYAALASLDANHDRQLSDGELSKLGLWFDKNQDAISQPGEVKTLTEVGVTKLFFEHDNERPGELIATKGFERKVGDAVHVGSSIDWSEKSVTDGSALVHEPTSPQSTSSLPKDPKDAQETKSSAQSDSSDEKLGGLWAWTIDGETTASGYLNLLPSSSGMQGTILTELRVQKSKKAASKILFSHFMGEVGKDLHNATKLTFTVRGDDGVTRTSSAILTPDGSQLVGETLNTNSRVSSSGKFTYSWKAVRVAAFRPGGAGR